MIPRLTSGPVIPRPAPSPPPCLPCANEDLGTGHDNRHRSGNVATPRGTSRSDMLPSGFVAICIAVVVGMSQLPAGSFVNDDRGVGV